MKLEKSESIFLGSCQITEAINDYLKKNNIDFAWEHCSIVSQKFLNKGMGSPYYPKVIQLKKIIILETEEN
jgi:hypothetical protein